MRGKVDRGEYRWSAGVANPICRDHIRGQSGDHSFRASGL